MQKLNEIITRVGPCIDIDLEHTIKCLREMDEDEGRELFNPEILAQPLEGLSSVVIYYDTGAPDLYSVRYDQDHPMTPGQILTSIVEFYRQPYDADICGERKYDDPDLCIGWNTGDHPHLASLEPHKDGYKTVLTC